MILKKRCGTMCVWHSVSSYPCSIYDERYFVCYDCLGFYTYFKIFFIHMYISQQLVHLRCLPRNLAIMGSNPTWVTTMILQMTPVLVAYRKWTSYLGKLWELASQLSKIDKFKLSTAQRSTDEDKVDAVL